MTNEEKVVLILRWECPDKNAEFLGEFADGTFWARGPMYGRYYESGAVAVSNCATNAASFDDAHQVTVYPTEMHVLPTGRTISGCYPVIQRFPLIVDREEFIAAARMCAALTN
jgi:hypothetical protein